MLNSKALAASVSAPPAVYVEDVFSTFLYNGNGSTQTITNGIDLAGKGGLVWIKGRSVAYDHCLQDTTRGANKILFSNLTLAEQNDTNAITTFNSTGWDMGAESGINANNQTFASWTFREQPKFFDIVTYTGTGSNTTIPHNLGSVPGCIIVKRRDSSGYWWAVYHRSLTNASYYLLLQETGAQANSSAIWNGTTPTNTVFSVGTSADTNASGGTYVAYLFAHDAGGFGTAGTDNVISCGSFTSNASGFFTATLGYEPQWVMYKQTNVSDDWKMIDTMRGMTNPYTNGARLLANSSAAEGTGNGFIEPTATGFYGPGTGAASGTYIYIAIRRGPMKTPTVGTEVFSPLAATLSSDVTRSISLVPDVMLYKYRTGNGNFSIEDRLRGFAKTNSNSAIVLATNLTTAETTEYPIAANIQNTTWIDGAAINGVPSIIYNLKRAPGFFDEVCYTGTGSALNPNHNLGVTPELKIIKSRSGAVSWIVGGTVIGGGVNFYMFLETNAIVETTNYWSSGSDSATTFSTRAGNAASNSNGQTYAAYLFATLAGVSKVGSYTGTGTTKQIDCGFTAGARFVMIKRTDSTGDWYVWDTARGVISGNDPYLLLNSTAAEVTGIDYIDPLSSGFEISSTAPAAINANGGTYIFLAIA